MEKGITFPFFFLHSLFFLLHFFFLLYIYGRNIVERVMDWMGVAKAPTPPTPTPDRPPLPKLDSDEDFHITGPRHMMTTSLTETTEIDWYGCTSCFNFLPSSIYVESAFHDLECFSHQINRLSFLYPHVLE